MALPIYIAGYFDGMRDEQPALLGVDSYRYAYERGVRDQLSNVPDGFALLGASDDLTERLYVHVESGTQVFARLDGERYWRASVPGYGVREAFLDAALRRSLNGGPCNNYGGIRDEDRSWFTAPTPTGSKMTGYHNVKLVAQVAS